MGTIISVMYATVCIPDMQSHAELIYKKNGNNVLYVNNGHIVACKQWRQHWMRQWRQHWM